MYLFIYSLLETILILQYLRQPTKWQVLLYRMKVFFQLMFLLAKIFNFLLYWSYIKCMTLNHLNIKCFSSNEIIGINSII